MSRPPPCTATILTAFLKIDRDADRKKVLDLARQLASVDADAET
jgi:hypothetical protein